MKKNTISIVFIFAFLFSNAAISPPSLRCLEVKNNGDVLITWIAPNDPNNFFKEYQIYFSPSKNGTYTQIATINFIIQTTFLHSGANAQNTDAFYYIRSVSSESNNNVSISSDTLQTIRITATNPLNGTAPILWNPLHSPKLSTSNTYLVFYEYPIGTWTHLANTANTNFIDTIEICNSFINFRVEQTDVSGCISISNIDGDNYQNLIAPKTPILDSVSINLSNQNAILGWQASTSADTYGYIVYFFNGVWIPIDTVYGINNTFYENTNSIANTKAESYCIAAIDSCNITSPLTNGHTSIFLSAIVDKCTRKANLTWSKYEGFGNIGEYKVYIIETRGNVRYKKTHIVSKQNLAFETDVLNDESTYCFYIKAISANGNSSTSNKVCETTDFADLPKWTHIRYASVNTDNSVEIKWVSDSTASINGYKIYSNNNLENTWTYCGFIHFSGQGEYSFIDISSKPNENVIFYRIAIIDECNLEAVYSDTAKTIYLSGKSEENMSNNLHWNNYETWKNGIQSFLLFRNSINNPSYEMVKVFDNLTFDYTDDVANQTNSSGIFSYRILAYEHIGNQYKNKDSVWSNTITLQQTPIFFMPNAFSPKGKNKTFGPVGMFVDNSSFSIAIFNRFGQEVFFSNDFNKQWDGTYNGATSPIGVYVYFLKLRLPSGQEIKQRGTVLLYE